MLRFAITYHPDYPCLLLRDSTLKSSLGERVNLYNSPNQKLHFGENMNFLPIILTPDEDIELDCHYRDNLSDKHNHIHIDLKRTAISKSLSICILPENNYIIWSFDNNSNNIIEYRLAPDSKIYSKFTQLLKSYCYRITINSKIDKNLVISGLTLSKSDGCKNIFNDKSISTYFLQAKPSRIKLSFSLTKGCYAIYIWLDEDRINNIFNKFYGAHPETKADFIISIDAKRRKYELALFRQGLKEPVVIPESAYQLIVFKNKFEDYRSANYNQPRGAWIW